MEINTAENKLVNIKELAQIMNVPVSWLYGRTRIDALPCVRFGKYIRFNPKEVIDYFNTSKSE